MLKRGMSVIIFLVLTTSVLAIDYYISNSGNDAWNGLYPDYQGGSDGPWRTIARINDFTSNPGFHDGDSINLKRGDVWSNDETLGWDGIGVYWGHIDDLTIQDYGPQELNLPWLNGNTQCPLFIADPDISHLTIKNIDISGLDWGNVMHEGGVNLRVDYVNHITIEGVYFDGHKGTSEYYHHAASIGVYMIPGDIEIRNCTVLNLYMDTYERSNQIWQGSDAQGIIIWYRVDDVPKLTGAVDIHDNIIRNVYADGIHLGGIQTTTSIYDNIISGFGEDAIDLKATRYATIYNNDLSWNSFGWSPGDPYWGPSLIISNYGGYWEGYETQDIVIRDNYLHDCSRRGIGASGRNFKIYRNHFKDIGLGIYIDGHPEIEVFSNIFELTKPADNALPFDSAAEYRVGIHLSQDNNHNVLIKNNTFYISSPNHVYGISVRANSGDSDNKIMNNIIYMTRNDDSVYPILVWDYDGTSTFPDVNHNLYFNPNHPNRIAWDGNIYSSYDQDQWRADGHTGGIFADPVFVNAGTDFHLKANSPACGSGVAGTDLGVFPCGSVCEEDWTCTDWSSWSECIGNQQTRTRVCTDASSCGTEHNKPDEIETQPCGSGENMLYSFRSLQGITIDGLLSEDAWRKSDHVEFQNPLRSDNTVRVCTIWDNGNLYFAFNVSDDLLEAVNQAYWQDDGAEIFLDTEHDKTASFDSDDYQFVITINDRTDIESIQSGTYKGTQRWTMEIKIPWSSIAKEPLVGMSMGLLLGNNDRDNSVIRQFDWLSLVETGDYFRPNLWGDIILLHAADMNKNQRIETNEMFSYIELWKQNTVTIGDLMDAIAVWKSCS